MSYRDTGSVEVDITYIVGITAQVKKTFDKKVKEALAKYCKQKGWKVSDCDVSASPVVRIKIGRKFPKEDQTPDLFDKRLDFSDR